MRPENDKKLLQLEKWHFVALFLMIYDAVMVNAAYFIALWLRFDCQFSAIPEEYLQGWLSMIPAYTVFCLASFILARLYNSIWEYASIQELQRMLAVSLIDAAFYVIFSLVFVQRMPISCYLFGAFIQFAAVLGVRFMYRFVKLLQEQRKVNALESRAMVIGAGRAGQMIIRDIQHSEKARDRVVCVIDDDKNKHGRYIEGVPVVGGRDEILLNVEKYGINKIFIAIPSASAEERRDIINICKESDCELKNLPGMLQIVSGEVSVSNMRDVSVEDLLGREPIKLDMERVMGLLSGKTVLVTGGGGSIGSELCRQIAAHSPDKLLILDDYENSAYDISLELKDRYPELDVRVIIASVRDSRRMFEVFETYRPQVVYHAAAHKHVPLMEANPCEAIKNNTIGTYKTAYAAMVHGCERFVLISTDKAVNPTNIMGASKRLCEMVIQSFDARIKAGRAGEIPQLFTHADLNSGAGGAGRDLSEVKTEFVAVRFGNVLGSNGSVIPIFKRQIANGGPVTVTHPDIIRYFMTIPEAVALVLTAGTYAKGGEIFVLDMGSPVKIDTLARNLIRLMGYKPDEDIKVEYTGLRPGEKLYEEKLMAEEGLTRTQNDLIFIGKPIPFDVDEFLSRLDGLMQAAYRNSPDIKKLVADMVSTYRPGKS